jgi:carbamoyltransferase
MPLILGIHSGHHASCAVVHNGVLVAAIEQERITRVKHDGQEGLSNRLPVRECLKAAGATLDDVDAIVCVLAAMEREKGKKGLLALASERRAA